MAPPTILAAVLLAVCVARSTASEATSIDRYPSIVAVESLGTFTGVWSQSCAASILNSLWILSAARCFDGLLYLPERRRIRAGSSYRNLGGQVVHIEREYNHETFGTLANDGDISVVRLASHLEYNPVIQPGYILSQGYVLPNDFPVINVGWGQGGEVSEVLHEMTVNTLDLEWCKELYSSLLPPALVTDNMLCSGNPEEDGKDSCVGDPGGPLYYRDAIDTLIVVGVGSWTNGCANDSYPGVYTSVSAYTDWIVEVTN